MSQLVTVHQDYKSTTVDYVRRFKEGTFPADGVLYLFIFSKGYHHIYPYPCSEKRLFEEQWYSPASGTPGAVSNVLRSPLKGCRPYHEAPTSPEE